jgi:hypothetical protein
MRLSLLTAALFETSYIQRVKGLQPIAYFPMNESQGRIANELINPSDAIGMHYEVEIGDAVGPDLQPASTYQNDANTSRTLINSTALIAAIDADLGSIMLWYKAARTDIGTKVLFHFSKDGTNYLRMRRTGADGYDFQHNIAGTLCDVTATDAGTSWNCLVATWDKANDRVRFYFNSTTPDEDSTMGVWVGPLSSLIVGANTNIGANPADGCIKHLAIFDYELTAAQVQTCMNIRGNNRSKELVSIASNAAAALAIDTYDLSDECTHPSVIDFGTNWNGYRYWMALTPLPGGDNEFENPQIMASADGDTWVEPGAIVNPIDAWPGEGFYNSDVNLVKDGSDLHCLYRTIEAGPWQGIHYRTSSDGENWGAEGDVLAVAVNQLLSPSCILDGSTYKLWVVDESGSANVVYYRTAAAITGAWSTKQLCTVPLPNYLEPWHIDVILVDSVFEMWVTALDSISAEKAVALFRLTSTDGIVFSNRRCILQPDSNKWDGRYIYKASAQSDGAGGYVIWYGGTDEDNVWKIGKTSI